MAIDSARSRQAPQRFHTVHHLIWRDHRWRQMKLMCHQSDCGTLTPGTQAARPRQTGDPEPMAFSPGHRKKMRHRLIDYFVERGPVDEGWRERPSWCSPYLWRSLLEELESEGCRRETRQSPSGRELTPFEAGHARRIVKEQHVSPEEARRMVLAERPAGQAVVSRSDPPPRAWRPGGRRSTGPKSSVAIFASRMSVPRSATPKDDERELFAPSRRRTARSRPR